VPSLGAAATPEKRGNGQVTAKVDPGTAPGARVVDPFGDRHHKGHYSTLKEVAPKITCLVAGGDQTAAETGHLVMSTLHTLDATETINRIISVFPPYQQKQVRIQLASVLRGVVSQRLVPRADGKGRVAAVEILKSTSRVRELIEDKDRTKEIHDAIAQGHQTYGMQTFDQSLMSLVQQGIIAYEEAHRQSTNPDDFALRFSGISATSDSKWDDFDNKPGEQKAVPGTAAFAQKGAPGGPTPPGRPAAPASPTARTSPGGPPPGARPAAGPPQVPQKAPTREQPAAKPAPGGDDDFQIERF
jgi:twitching motility protein PilT